MTPETPTWPPTCERCGSRSWIIVRGNRSVCLRCLSESETEAAELREVLAARLRLNGGDHALS